MAVEDVYYHSEDQPLSKRIVQVIERYKGTDLDDTDFQLVDHVDPDALDNLFESSDGDIEIQFFTSDMEVTLRGSNEIKIRVTPQNYISAD